MQNELGVNQHHDAVTGTGKQKVANDYALRLFKGMKQNNVEYGKLIKEKASKHLSLEALGEVSQCFATNSTYLDCPIAEYTQEEGYTMTVFVHNPSPVDLESVRIAVPNGNFKVNHLEFDGMDQITTPLLPPNATVTCHTDHIENGQDIKSCFLDAKIPTPAFGMSSFNL
jgi:hypothetical protein